ncbi:MAG: DUF86 domain-containing protein [Bacteroidia bacterium]|jgi:uncharacterized protein with HEPN domain
MKKDDSIYIEHIIQALRQITIYIEGLNEDDFLKNSLVQDAVIRQFEVIGEATKRISKDYREQHNHIPWQDMAGMRDKLIHDYIDVDLWVVYRTAKLDVPELLSQITKI